MNKIIFFTLFISTFSLNANDFQTYLNEQNQSFDKYSSSLKEEFENYKKAYEKGLDEYKKEISQYWPTTDISTQHKFVQYSSDYGSKKAIDFEKETIEIEVIAKNEKEAREKIQSSLTDLFKEDVKTAYKKDQLENKISKELNQNIEVNSQEKIIGDTLTSKQKKEFIEVTENKNLQKKQHNNNTIYTLNVKLPSDTMVKKAQQFKTYVNNYSKKNNINKELIYAVIHSESSFNPMARSYIPAFGLMQIVPQSAGIDTYLFLYGKKRILSSQYLYNSENNIKIGSTYLHIVYFKYLRHIKDPLSRLYCTMAAYNTGAGNVARSFIGSNNTTKASEKINTMTSKEVYNHLMRNLPYSETKRYLQKVNDRRFVYLKLLEKNSL